MESEEDFDKESSSESGFNEDEFDSTEPKVGQETKKRKYGDIASEEGTSTKKRKKKEKPPTVDEIRNWKETENLYSNSLFRLQIEELLSEIRIKNKRHKNLSSWLQQFETVLENLHDCSMLMTDIKKSKKRKKTETEILANKLADYKCIYETDQKLTITLTKPERCEKFGLYENNSLPGPNVSLNLNLIMPRDGFEVKDYLNNRYLCKRYYYLLYIAECLKSSDIIENISVAFHDSNSLLPILRVEPKDCDKTVVNIYASPSIDTFKPVRFLPETNNVKQDVFGTNLDKEILRSSSTIFYNSALGYDVTLSPNINFIKQKLNDQKGVQEAVKLLCVWLKQREFDVGLGSFTEDLVLYFVVYLFSKNKISKFMSSYQVVRSFWNFISTSDLENNPISISEVSKEVLESFKKYFRVVCLDVTGCYNVASFLNYEVYKRIKMESDWAVQCLNDNKSSSFQQLFLTKVPFYLQYDLIIDLTPSLPLEDNYDLTEAEKSQYVGYQDLLIVDYITKTFQRALNKRISNFVPRLEVDEENTIKKFFFGVNLNTEHAFSPLEIGPALHDHFAAADFRKFWGRLSSDRRFRDSSTNVTAYFRTNTIKGKRGIIKKILRFVIDEKLELKDNLHYEQFEEILISKKLVPSYPSGTNEETCLKIIQAADELGKKIRNMEMSLKITGIQMVSDVFNYSEMFPPIPANYKAGKSLTIVKGNSLVFSEKKLGMVPRYVHTVDCVLQLELSSKWPNDLQAVRHIKTSFFLEISKFLSSSHKILSHVSPDFIDVYFEGIVFRYRLHVPKEIALIKRQMTESGLTCYQESLNSFEMEKAFNIMPKVAGALRGIQSQNPSFGPGTALIKRWLRSQLIDEFYFPDIVINLLNASLYLNNVFSQSNSPQISFLRFLKFFSEFDWKLQIILANFNDELTKEQVTELESNLQENRDKFPALYIAMPFDECASVFTKQAPSKEILFRVKELAKLSLEFVNGVIMGQNHVGIKELFIPNFDGYNVLIHLRPLFNPRSHEQIVFVNVENRIVVEKYKPAKDDKLPIVNFNPVEKYLELLRKNYGKYAMFFHDTYGGNTIGVLWNPKVYETVDFKVSNVNAGSLVDGKLAFNMDVVIEDFYILGKDLVKVIDKK